MLNRIYFSLVATLLILLVLRHWYPVLKGVFNVGMILLGIVSVALLAVKRKSVDAWAVELKRKAADKR